MRVQPQDGIRILICRSERTSEPFLGQGRVQGEDSCPGQEGGLTGILPGYSLGIQPPGCEQKSGLSHLPASGALDGGTGTLGPFGPSPAPPRLSHTCGTWAALL